MLENVVISLCNFLSLFFEYDPSYTSLDNDLPIMWIPDILRKKFTVPDESFFYFRFAYECMQVFYYTT